jgi:hypothetical protein
MKLCPLFESIETPDTIKGRFQSELYWTGIHATNAKLPREAIEAAIDALEFIEFLPHSEAVNERYIEQLRALLPEGD